MRVPIAIIFGTKPGRGEILIRRGKGSDRLWNIPDPEWIVVFLRRYCTASQGQCCNHDHRIFLKHIYLTLWQVSRVLTLNGAFQGSAGLCPYLTKFLFLLLKL